MRFVVPDSLFSDPNHTPDLWQLITAADNECIILEIEPSGPAATCFANWLDSRPSDRKWIERAVNDSELRATRRPNAILVEVTRDTTSLEHDPLKISLSDAAALSRMPFEILVEDGESDKNFLLCLASEPWKEELQSAIDSGRLKFIHGGGDRIISHIKGLRRIATLRCFPIYDSDSLCPDHVGKRAKDKDAACEEVGIRIHHRHRLKRREAENYLSKSVLEGWARRSGRRDERLRKSRCFSQLSDVQRCFFNVKDGFEGDQHNHERIENAESIDALYDDVPERCRTALANGLTRQVTEAFDPTKTTADQFDNEAREEITTVINKILHNI